MKEALQGIEKEAQRLIAAADSSAVIEELRVRFLGKKGELTSILKQMGGLTAEERPIIGALANEVREDIDAQIRLRTKALSDAVLEKRLLSESMDVTLPGNMPKQGKRHPFDQV
ncbi:MAG: phenylalanine--tRNA ligase subunit alpha, partial [Oscillospiraceae bacterium]